MNARMGWLLAALLLLTSWQAYGWQGAVVAVTVTVFWLLLQFNRTLRVMKNASAAPIGHIGSAVMLNAKLRNGMTLLQVVAYTQSLGAKLSEVPETWAWTDQADNRVTLMFDNAKLSRWVLTRGEASEAHQN